MKYQKYHGEGTNENETVRFIWAHILVLPYGQWVQIVLCFSWHGDGLVDSVLMYKNM